ncbi:MULTISPECIES: hypothetical protein [unclassified Pseudomonas]|uniref:hypothetical protein n=1 Tax=unclassified Pseudomonas TaxID=196821 RepID=UPI001140549F|nr:MULTISPECIES: hypothetical protein [unclassified Pseudomonas]
MKDVQHDETKTPRLSAEVPLLVCFIHAETGPFQQSAAAFRRKIAFWPSGTGLFVDPEVTSGFTVAGLLRRKTTLYVVVQIAVIRSGSSIINVL